MDPFYQALVDNKKSKGATLDAVLAHIAILPDPNTLIPDPRNPGRPKSALATAIELAPNEQQAAKLAQALLHRGADVKDAVIDTLHDKAINQAIRKSYYTLAFLLIDQGALLDDIVHQWMRRPKTVGEARGQMGMEQRLWQHYALPEREEYHVPIMASLMACEVLTGDKTATHLQDEIMTMARQIGDEREWNNHTYILSNLSDAALSLKNPAKATERLLDCMVRWWEGMDGDALEPNDLLYGNLSGISADFWTRLPGARADAQAKLIDEHTSLAPRVPKARF